jgi:uncharacterized protein YggL (DUF469 family)
MRLVYRAKAYHLIFTAPLGRYDKDFCICLAWRADRKGLSIFKFFDGVNYVAEKQYQTFGCGRWSHRRGIICLGRAGSWRGSHRSARHWTDGRAQGKLASLEIGELTVERLK